MEALIPFIPKHLHTQSPASTALRNTVLSWWIKGG